MIALVMTVTMACTFPETPKVMRCVVRPVVGAPYVVHVKGLTTKVSKAFVFDDGFETGGTGAWK